MKRSFFKNYEELSDYMIDKAQDGLYTVAVLFYNDAINLLRELMRCDDVEIEALDIKPEEYNRYSKEYYVSMADDMIVSVEPAYVCGRYLDAEADLILIDGDASSAIIKNLHDDKCCEIYIYCSKAEEECDFVIDCVSADDLFKEFFADSKSLRDKNGKVIGIKMDTNFLWNT